MMAYWVTHIKAILYLAKKVYDGKNGYNSTRKDKKRVSLWISDKKGVSLYFQLCGPYVNCRIPFLVLNLRGIPFFAITIIFALH